MNPGSSSTQNATTASALPEVAGDLAGALDLLLADGALGVLRRFRPDGATLRLAASLARNPEAFAGQAAVLGTELGRIATGRSQVAPERKDRRFADPAWTQNPVLKRAMQAYLATAQAAELMLAHDGPGLAGCGAAAVRLDEPDRGRISEQQPAAQPGRYQGAGGYRRVVRGSRAARPAA